MKREVKVLGLSYSQSQAGSYIVVLSEKNGKRKLPIVIKPADAQQIALKIEGMKSPRPLTHDLFKSLTDIHNIDILEVYIYSVLEGIFYTKMVTSDRVYDVEIECMAGDGIALSIVYGCPLYVSDEVLNISGIYINDDGTSIPEEEIDNTPDVVEEDFIPKRVVSIEDLEHMMEDAINNEEYEIAAEIRDRISKIRGEND